VSAPGTVVVSHFTLPSESLLLLLLLTVLSIRRRSVFAGVLSRGGVLISLSSMDPLTVVSAVLYFKDSLNSFTPPIPTHNANSATETAPSMGLNPLTSTVTVSKDAIFG